MMIPVTSAIFWETLPVILVKYGKKSMDMIIELFLFIQPHKGKFDINNEA